MMKMGLQSAYTLAREHQAETLGYLKATGCEHASLMSVGSFRFRCRKSIWSNDRPLQHCVERIPLLMYYVFFEAIPVAVWE